ncbi:MAG: hypothetical protein HY719_16905 [Planctomycetes bacterium]|nr:hypothetical protein [Planctomycetota bacterium]
MLNMPAEFLGSGREELDNESAREALSRFVSDTLSRCNNLNDMRVHALRDGWRAIQNADTGEEKFCSAAGRMGVDPYDPSELTTELANFISDELDDPDRPIARDLMEVASLDFVAAQWRWIRGAVGARFGAREGARERWGTGSVPPSPWECGYALADEVRKAARVSHDAPLPAVESVCAPLGVSDISDENDGTLPGAGVRALVGWTATGALCVVGPKPPRATASRFRLSRGLYIALAGCDAGARLVTDAYTWDQQASRAFAAELLAPRSAVSRMAAGAAGPEEVAAISAKYEVSARVVERQLENAGVPLTGE